MLPRSRDRIGTIVCESLLTQALRSVLPLLILVTLFFHPRTFAQQESLSFEFDVLPLLTKHGCNSGACHGAVAGRGQFFLSLWGSDPKADYDQIVQAFGSRRVRFQEPEKSLLIAKPSGRIAHEGGERFEPESSMAMTLVRWIQQGAPMGSPVKFDALEISADAMEASTGAPEYRLSAAALSADSSQRIDVSDRTLWEIDPNGGVEWKGHEPPEIRLNRPGRHLINARFAGKTRALVLIAPYPTSAGPSDVSIKLDPSSESAWIDAEVQHLLQIANLRASPSVDDLTWLRRVSLDLVGRIPTLEEIERFEKTPLANRKSMAVDELIRSDAFGRYWTLQLARWLGVRPIGNDPQATQAFVDYLRTEVSRKVSWKQLAEQMLLSIGDSHQVGPANFGRLASDARAHAELVGRVFMGSRIGCANCHNHPLDRWTQDDYHGLAAILAGIDRGRQVRFVAGGQVTNLRTKEPAVPKLPGAEYLSIPNDTQAVGANMEQLSRWLLDEQKDPRFARVLANRLWASMMGRGLVHPIDDFRETNPASHPHLLDRMAQRLVDSDYQPAVLLRSIALSQAYASSKPQADARRLDPSFFGARLSMPLPPEVLYDAIHDALGLTGQERAVEWIDPTTPSESLDILGRCGKATGCEFSSNANALDASLVKQLHWINGPLVNEAIESPMAFVKRELATGVSNDVLLERAYLRILTKRIDPEKLERWSKQIPAEQQQRRSWFEDWVWSLLSSDRFINN